MRRRLVPLLTIVLLACVGLGAVLATDTEPSLGLDLQGGISVVLAPTEEDAAEQDGLEGRLDQAVAIIRQRVDGLGVAEPEISRQGEAIVVQLPGVDDRDRVLELLGSTAELRFRPVIESMPAEAFHAAAAEEAAGDADSGDADDSADSDDADSGDPETDDSGDADSEADDAEADVDPEAQVEGEGDGTGEGGADDAPGMALTHPDDDEPEVNVTLEDGEGDVVYELGPMMATGQIVQNAQANLAQGQWLVNLTFRSGEEGIDQFNQAAGMCYQRGPECPSGALAIVLDSEVQSAPAINEPVFERDAAQISGGMEAGFSEREAKDLALVLRYGALPVELERQSFETVSASLGDDSLQAGIVAGAIGLFLVAGYMLFYYRILGLVVIAGMSLWAVLMYTVISWMSATQGLALTLAGVTGIIISVGVTVDSYVVYFEQLKDEVKMGRPLRSSADRAFKRAWRTIVAANVATLIGAGVLWWWTVGAVRGFAFFLGLASLLGLLVTITFTGSVVSLIARSPRVRSARWFGLAGAVAAPDEGAAAAPSRRPVAAGGTS